MLQFQMASNKCSMNSLLTLLISSKSCLNQFYKCKWKVCRLGDTLTVQEFVANLIKPPRDTKLYASLNLVSYRTLPLDDLLEKFLMDLPTKTAYTAT